MKPTKWNLKSLLRSIGLFGLISVAGYLAVTFAGIDMLAAILLGGFAFFGCLILFRMVDILFELRSVRAEAHGLREFENDINRRLDAFGTSGGTSESQLAQASLVDKLAKEVASLRERLQHLEQRGGTEPETVQADPIAAAATQQPPEQRSTTGVIAKPSTLSRLNLKTALDNGGLSLHLQPIVELPTRKPLQYEAFMRLQMKNGDFLDARQFIKVATKGGLMPMIDKKVLFSCVRMLRTLDDLKKRAGLYCNLSSDTLSDARAFRELAKFLESNAALNESLVLEINQRTLRSLNVREKERLLKIADLGFSLSLDNVNDLALDGPALYRQGFRTVKTPAGVLLHGGFIDKIGLSASELPRALASEGIALIGTEVERESEVFGLIDFGVAQAQGLIFAPPRPVKQDLLTSGRASGQTNNEPEKAASAKKANKTAA